MEEANTQTTKIPFPNEGRCATSWDLSAPAARVEDAHQPYDCLLPVSTPSVVQHGYLPYVRQVVCESKLPTFPEEETEAQSKFGDSFHVI